MARVMSLGFDALRGCAAMGSDDSDPNCNPSPQECVPGPFDDNDSDFVPGPFETKLTAAKHSPSSPGKNVTPSKSPSDLTAKHAPYDHGGRGPLPICLSS